MAAAASATATCFPPARCARRSSAQLARADALLVIGAGAGADAVIAAAPGLPVFHGRLEPDAQAVAALRPHKVLAFAGIGDPEKFFATLSEAGIDVAARQAFADHHRYRGAEAAGLIARAGREGLALVTTEKDLARLKGESEVARAGGTGEGAAGAARGDRGGGVPPVGARSGGLKSVSARNEPPQHRLRRGVGLLQVHAPVLELLERDRRAGHRAAHERARPDDAEIAVEIFDLGFSRHRRGAIVAIEQVQASVTANKGRAALLCEPR